jgi:DNA helicase-2/ATP-dependent DNA helicase PcrA
MKDDFTKTLNPLQLEAVLHFNTPLLVIAGAGSGKTKVITYKIAYLIQNNGISPLNILGVTFTNRAASEMKNRVNALTGLKPKSLNISTFHSLGLRILRESGTNAGFDKDWQVIDDQDQKKILNQIIRDHFNYFTNDMRDYVKRKIDYAKMNLNYPNNKEYLFQKGFGEDEVKIFSLYYDYQKEMKLWDYEDLVSLPVILLQTDEKLKKTYQEKFHYVVVDEFQDTNPNQYELVKLVAGESKNITIVGDDDQAVYSWRGASLRYLFNFESDFPGTQIIKLEQNYRSTQQILDFANDLIKNNRLRREKAMWTDKREGSPVFLINSHSKEEEAALIGRYILQLKEENPQMFPLAVLYRINSQSLALETEFVKLGINFKVLKGLRFFDRKEIKDSLALLKLAVNPQDDISFLRMVEFLPLGIGTKTLESLRSISEKNNLPLFPALKEFMAERFNSKEIFGSIYDFFQKKEKLQLCEILTKLLKTSEYLDFLETKGEQDRILNINELVEFLRTWEGQHPGETMNHFLDHISLGSGEDKTSHKENVFLLTMHNSKGLEFPTVIVSGVNGTYMPFFLRKDNAEKEEERRLFYVAATRAINQLIVSTGANKPSPFLREINRALYSNVYSLDDLFTYLNQRTGGGKTESGLQQGSSEERFLEHPVFGRGKIINAIDDEKYVVAFKEKGEKTIDTSIVPVTFL